MTGDQMIYVLRMLTTAYPEFHLTEPGAVLWAKHFKDFDFDDANAAADQWIVSSERFPKINQLTELTRTVMRNRRDNESALALSEAPPTPEQRSQIQEMMATTRSLLTNMRKKQHWHGGPNPCEICGGMKS